jgi:outer membrane murein-binding lipoprotein Lpp
MKKKVEDLRSDVQLLEDKVAMAEGDYNVMKEKYAREKRDSDKTAVADCHGVWASRDVLMN